MNWLTNSVLPKIKALVSPREVPDSLWTRCPGCGEMIFHRQLADNLQVCPHCEHHMRMRAPARLAMLFDDGESRPVDLPAALVDPLKFRDRKRYTERLREAQASTGLADAIMVAEGAIEGVPAVVAVFEFGFMGGSMGAAVGDALLRAAERAARRQVPLIVFPSSGGARMQEGILSLMQMPRTVIAAEQVKEAGQPFIIVLTDPTTGGVTASFAMLGDIHLAEPGAIIGFAGQRVIRETIREQLPDGFQRSEYLHAHGMIDMVVARRDLKPVLARILRLLRHPRPETEEAEAVEADLAIPAVGALPAIAAGPAEEGGIETAGRNAAKAPAAP